MSEANEAAQPDSEETKGEGLPTTPPVAADGDAAGNPQADPSDAPSDKNAAAISPEKGWYPDPNAGGANIMRYWSGSAWTEKVKEGVTEINTTRRSADERKVILAQQVQTAAARGLRIESQSDFQAILVQGQPVNHTLHAILTIFTCLLWGIVWAIITATGGEKREMIVVDEFGNVQHQKLGKV